MSNGLYNKTGAGAAVSSSVIVSGDFLGAIVTGSLTNSRFHALALSASTTTGGNYNAAYIAQGYDADEQLSTAAWPQRYLSQSFSGFSGSIIQVCNFLKHKIDQVNTDAAVTFTEVKDALAAADAAVDFNDQNVTGVGALTATSLTASNGVVSGAVGEFHTKVSGTHGYFNDVTIGGVALATTVTELNYLDGLPSAVGTELVALSDGELEVLDGASAGTVANSKAVVYSAAGVVQGTDFKGPDGFDVGNGTNADFMKFNANEIVVKDTNDITFDIASHDPAQSAGLKLGGTLVTSTAAEINLLDGSSAGTVENSKAVIYSAGGAVVGSSLTASNGVVSGAVGEFHTKVSGTHGYFNDVTIGGVALATTVTELNYLDGLPSAVGTELVALSDGELEVLDGVTGGTAAASKAVVLDSSKDVAGLNSVSLAGLTGSGAIIVAGNIASNAANGSNTIGSLTAPWSSIYGRSLVLSGTRQDGKAEYFAFTVTNGLLQVAPVGVAESSGVPNPS